jgi:Yip1 domain
MNLIERIKNILITPKTEWDVINGETATAQSLLMGYVLPLAVVGAVGGLLRGLLFAGSGVLGMKFLIAGAVIGFVVGVVSYYATVYIVDMLAPSFASEKDLGKSAQLVAYSYTPSAIAGLLSFIPVIGFILPFLAWGYGIYLMYLGIGPLKKTPEDKKVIYIIVAYAIMIAIFFVLTAILTAVLFASLGGVAAIAG